MKGTEEENRKILLILSMKKTFQPGLRTGKEKPRMMERDQD